MHANNLCFTVYHLATYSCVAATRIKTTVHLGLRMSNRSIAKCIVWQRGMRSRWPFLIGMGQCSLSRI